MNMHVDIAPSLHTEVFSPVCCSLFLHTQIYTPIGCSLCQPKWVAYGNVCPSVLDDRPFTRRVAAEAATRSSRNSSSTIIITTNTTTDTIIITYTNTRVMLCLLTLMLVVWCQADELRGHRVNLSGEHRVSAQQPGQ